MECNAGCADGIFCQICLENNKKSSCANCRQEQGFKATTVRNMVFLNEKKVKCGRESCKGQNTVMTYEEFIKNHTKFCLDKKVTCPLCKKKTIRETDKDIHLEHCQSMVEKCQLCDDMVPRKDLEDHLKNECPKTEISCDRCEQKIIRSKLGTHLENVCEEVYMNCVVKECSARFKRKNL